jgi:parallel beta-helix repeat protein
VHNVKKASIIVLLPLLFLALSPMNAQQVGGDVTVTLKWMSPNQKGPDLDLHVIDPAGERIFFDHPVSKSGGKLDHDDRCKEPGDFQETITWPRGQAPSGVYQVEIDYFETCQAEGTVIWQVTVAVDGRTQEFKGTISPGERRRVSRFIRGDSLKDTTGQPIGTPDNPLPPQETASLTVSGLKPNGIFKIEVARKGGPVICQLPRVRADNFGNLLNLTLCWDMGFDANGDFQPDQAAGEYEVRVSGEGITKTIPMFMGRRSPRPFLFPANDRGQLSPGFLEGESVYVRGFNLPANRRFPIYVCRDRSVWEEGFSLEQRCTGTEMLVELKWEAPADLDLWVEDPLGNVASFENPITPIDGQLETDQFQGPAVERFRLPEAPAGEYKIWVTYFQGTGEVPFTISVAVAGDVKTFPGKLSQEGDSTEDQPIRLMNSISPLKVTVQTDTQGNLSTTLVWPKARLGDWDLIADLDGSGAFTTGDAVWQVQQTGFVVAKAPASPSLSLVEGSIQAQREIRLELASDENGNYKNVFMRGEPIYIWANPKRRPGIPTSGSVDKYIVKSRPSWNQGDKIIEMDNKVADVVRAKCINQTPVLISNGLEPGLYDAVIDVNQNGQYDVGIDILDSPGFEVASTFGGKLSPLQDEIRKAKDGAEIPIDPGTYEGNLLIPEGKRLTLEIKSGGKVIFKGDGRAPVIHVQRNATLVLTVEAGADGFTITGGINGILIEEGGKVEIRGAVLSQGGQQQRFLGTITDNREWGIRISRGSKQVVVYGVTITANGKGGILVEKNSNASLSLNIITNNQGDGVAVKENSNAKLNNNTIVGNTGCGISKDSGSKAFGKKKDRHPQQDNTVNGNNPDFCGL